MVTGIHRSFFVLGAVTVLSTIVFRELKVTDGENASRHRVIEAD
jgi:hypothetical protein